MSGTLKEVRFIRPWQTYSKGAIITPNGLLRDWLIGNGYVEVIEANTAKAPLVQRVKNAVNRALPKSQVTRDQGTAR